MLSDKIMKIAMQIKISITNEDVIKMFLEDTFPKDKKPVWGTKNLTINKKTTGWSLNNYDTPIVFRNKAGKVFFNTEKYSTTTTQIQNKIKAIMKNLKIKYKEINEEGILKII